MTPVFISVDAIGAAEKAKAAYAVPFPLLSDAKATVHEAFRVVNALGPKGVARLKGYGHDVDQWSGQSHHKIAIPSMFLIDTTGTIRWAHAHRNYRTRPKIDALLGALKAVLVP